MAVWGRNRGNIPQKSAGFHAFQGMQVDAERRASGGQGWIRTSVRLRGQIYSLLPLTTRPPVHLACQLRDETAEGLGDPAGREAPLWRSGACLSMAALAGDAAIATREQPYGQDGAQESAARTRGTHARWARKRPREHRTGPPVGSPRGRGRAQEPRAAPSQAVGDARGAGGTRWRTARGFHRRIRRHARSRPAGGARCPAPGAGARLRRARRCLSRSGAEGRARPPRTATRRPKAG